MDLQVIKEQLQEQKLELSTLIRGICTERDMQTYRSERFIDRLTLDALLQRLNVSVNHFPTYMSETEYVYFGWRMKVLRAAARANWETVHLLIENDNAYGPAPNSRLRKQFLLTMKGILAVELNQDCEQAERCFVEALKLTHPDVSESLSGILQRMSTQEWCALLNLLSAYCQSGNGEVKKALQKVLRRLDTSPLPSQDQMKIYSFATKLLAEIYLREKRFATCEKICDKAINLLYYECGLGQLIDLLQIAILCKHALEKKDEEERYLCQLSVLQKVLTNCETKTQGRWLLTPLMETEQEIVIYGKMIEQTRKEKSLTREKLSDGICSTKTLMRIEKGLCSPRTEIVRELMKKLGLPDPLLGSEIASIDISTFELHDKLKHFLFFRDKEEFAGYLSDYEEHLDLSIMINRQWLEMFRNNQEYIMGRRTIEKYMAVARDVLRMSLPDFSIKHSSFTCLNQVELLLLLQLADGYTNQGDYKSAISICENILQYYDRYEIEIEYQCSGRVLVMYTLAVNFQKMELYGKSLEWCRRAFELQILCEKSIKLPELVMCQAETLGKSDNTSESLQYYEAFLELSEMF